MAFRPPQNTSGVALPEAVHDPVSKRATENRKLNVSSFGHFLMATIIPVRELGR
jgi:hypothetical protein